MQGLADPTMTASPATAREPWQPRRPFGGADAEPFAMVRFINNTPGHASVAIGGKSVFLGIPTGKVTDYAVVSRPLVAFTLTTADPVGDPVTIDQRIEDGARYTLTAKVTLDGTARLVVTREEQPAPELRSEW